MPPDCSDASEFRARAASTGAKIAPMKPRTNITSAAQSPSFDTMQTSSPIKESGGQLQPLRHAHSCLAHSTEFVGSEKNKERAHERIELAIEPNRSEASSSGHKQDKSVNRKQIDRNPLKEPQLVSEGEEQQQQNSDPNVEQQQQQQQQQEQEALRILEKSSFVCTLIGKRQTGKRSIVKCLVKIVDEFKLAASEYKREKILIKLLDCAERMQQLQAEREQTERVRQELAQLTANNGSSSASNPLRFDRKLSSAAQWIASEAMAKLRATSNGAKYKRNHSMAVPLGINNGLGTSSNSLMTQHQQQLAPNQTLNLRRHTEFGPPKLLIQTSDEIADEEEQHELSQFNTNKHIPPLPFRSSSSPTTPMLMQSDFDDEKSLGGKFLTVIGSSGGGKQTSNCDLRDQHQMREANLQIESGVSQITGKNTDKKEWPGEGKSANCRQRARSNVNITLPLPSSQNEPRSLSFSFASNLKPEHLGTKNSDQDIEQEENRPTSAFGFKDQLQHNLDQVFCELEPTENTRIDRLAQLRQLLNLKQLNRRRIRVRFRSRRLLTGNTLEALQQTSLQLEDQDSRQPVKLGSSKAFNSKAPDCIIFVYAVNDRASFEYAKMLIKRVKTSEQIMDSKQATRTINYRCSMPPIILVANKIDLERSKVVKTEEGRSLAAKYSCKFIEISCTIGFNLDNLLAGIRTQLILRHHMALNSIFKLQDAKEQQRTNAPDKADKSGPSDGKQAEVNRGFVRRIFRRYLADNDHYNDYDCDNFYKL